MGLRARLRLARTLVVVDARHHDATALAADLFAHGADIVAVRDPGASLEALRRTVEHVQRVAMPLNKLVAVSGDLEAARAAMADVLVAGDDLDPALAHARLHEYALVGVPAAEAEELPHLGESHDVDFILLSTGDETGRSAATDRDLVRAAAEALPVADPHGTPWFVPCDVTGKRLPDLVGAGARRVMLTVDAATDLRWVRHIADGLRGAWQGDPALEDFAFRVLSNPGPPARFRSPTEPTTW